jgi:hypothetical protein
MLGRHPTLWIALINTVVMGVATLGFRWLDGDQAVLVVGAVNGIAAAANAWAVRPIQPALFTYAVGTIIAVFAAYGLNVTPEQLAALNSLTVAVLGFLTYGNVSPVDTAISQSTTAQAATPVQTVPEAQPNP